MQNLFFYNPDFLLDYPRYCFEHLPDEIDRLKQQGRSGVEAIIAANQYRYRVISESDNGIKQL